MPNSLRAKLSKLRYKGNITDAEYQELISKLDGHDNQIRANAIDECINEIKKHDFLHGNELLKALEQLKEKKND